MRLSFFQSAIDPSIVRQMRLYKSPQMLSGDRNEAVDSDENKSLGRIRTAETKHLSESRFMILTFLRSLISSLAQYSE